jgi:hypothetical protein
MVNSSWTKSHIVNIWKIPERTKRVYPPCDTSALQACLESSHLCCYIFCVPIPINRLICDVFPCQPIMYSFNSILLIRNIFVNETDASPGKINNTTCFYISCTVPSRKGNADFKFLVQPYLPSIQFRVTHTYLAVPPGPQSSAGGICTCSYKARS